MTAMIWRSCLNHNGSLCRPEVRWCEFFPDPPTPVKSAFDALEEFCRSCPNAVPIIHDDRCPYCAGSGMRWGSPKSVLTSRPEPDYLYHYVCQHCGKDAFSKELVIP